MTHDLEHLGRQVDKLSDAIEENTNEKGENNMNDIAGLLAQECTSNTNRLADENARLTRENEALKDTICGDRAVDAAVQAVSTNGVTNVPPGASA